AAALCRSVPLRHRRSPPFGGTFAEIGAAKGVARARSRRSVSRARISRRARETHGELPRPAADRARTGTNRARAPGGASGGAGGRRRERCARLRLGVLLAFARHRLAAGLPG